jgi:hypothetical protein
MASHPPHLHPLQAEAVAVAVAVVEVEVEVEEQVALQRVGTVLALEEVVLAEVARVMVLVIV